MSWQINLDGLLKMRGAPSLTGLPDKQSISTALQCGKSNNWKNLTHAKLIQAYPDQ